MYREGCTKEMLQLLCSCPWLYVLIQISKQIIYSINLLVQNIFRVHLNFCGYTKEQDWWEKSLNRSYLFSARTWILVWNLWRMFCFGRSVSERSFCSSSKNIFLWMGKTLIFHSLEWAFLFTSSLAVKQKWRRFTDIQSSLF